MQQRLIAALGQQLDWTTFRARHPVCFRGSFRSGPVDRFEFVDGIWPERVLSETNKRPNMTKSAALQRVKQARPGGFEPPTYGLEVPNRVLKNTVI